MERVPTYDDFKRGLRGPVLADLDLRVLECFLQAEAFALTSAELARELGSEGGHEYGNLRIGTLGGHLAEAMSFTPNLRKSDQTPMYWNVVASGADRETDGRFVYTLHADLVAALRQFPRHPTSNRRDIGAVPRDELPDLTPEQSKRIEARRSERRRDHKNS